MQTASSPLNRALDAVALMGVAVWVVLLLVLHLIRARTTDITTDAMSLYAIGDFGYLMTAAFVGFGLAHLALATSLRRQRGLWMGPSLLAIVGLCLLGSAIFATDPKDADPLTAHGIIHVQLALVGFVLMALMPLIFAASLRRIPGWRRSTWASLVLGCATIAAFLAMPLVFKDAYFGIGQRLFIAVYVSWLTVMILSGSRSSPARVDWSLAHDRQPSSINR